MANQIALFKACVPILDEVYKEASKTAMLDGRAGSGAGGGKRQRADHSQAGHAGPWRL